MFEYPLKPVSSQWWENSPGDNPRMESMEEG